MCKDLKTTGVFAIYRKVTGVAIRGVVDFMNETLFAYVCYSCGFTTYSENEFFEHIEEHTHERLEDYE